jgi:hypothetical protein
VTIRAQKPVKIVEIDLSANEMRAEKIQNISVGLRTRRFCSGRDAELEGGAKNRQRKNPPTARWRVFVRLQLKQYSGKLGSIGKNILGSYSGLCTPSFSINS